MEHVVLVGMVAIMHKMILNDMCATRDSCEAAANLYPIVVPVTRCASQVGIFYLWCARLRSVLNARPTATSIPIHRCCLTPVANSNRERRRRSSDTLRQRGPAQHTTSSNNTQQSAPTPTTIQQLAALWQHRHHGHASRPTDRRFALLARARW